MTRYRSSTTKIADKKGKIQEYAKTPNKLTFLIRSKVIEHKNDYHKEVIIPYVNKWHVKDDAIVFIFSTGDDYMKDAFIERGWIENTVMSSTFFDLRWDLNEKAVNVFVIVGEL